MNLSIELMNIGMEDRTGVTPVNPIDTGEDFITTDSDKMNFTESEYFNKMSEDELSENEAARYAVDFVNSMESLNEIMSQARLNGDEINDAAIAIATESVESLIAMMPAHLQSKMKSVSSLGLESLTPNDQAMALEHLIQSNLNIANEGLGDFIGNAMKSLTKTFKDITGLFLSHKEKAEKLLNKVRAASDHDFKKGTIHGKFAALNMKGHADTLKALDSLDKFFNTYVDKIGWMTMWGIRHKSWEDVLNAGIPGDDAKIIEFTERYKKRLKAMGSKGIMPGTDDLNRYPITDNVYFYGKLDVENGFFNDSFECIVKNKDESSQEALSKKDAEKALMKIIDICERFEKVDFEKTLVAFTEELGLAGNGNMDLEKLRMLNKDTFKDLDASALRKTLTTLGVFVCFSTALVTAFVGPYVLMNIAVIMALGIASGPFGAMVILVLGAIGTFKLVTGVSHALVRKGADLVSDHNVQSHGMKYLNTKGVVDEGKINREILKTRSEQTENMKQVHEGVYSAIKECMNLVIEQSLDAVESSMQ